MTAYGATLQNDTDSVWTLVIYVTLPAAASMLSVAWQVSAPVANHGSADVSWTDTPAVCLGTSSGVPGAQSFKQTLWQQAAVDQGWVVGTTGGALTLTLSGSSPTPGQIAVTNNSGQTTNIALGYSAAAAVYSQNVSSGVAVGFVPVPTYWALITQSAIKRGDVVAYASTPAKLAQTNLIELSAGQYIPPIRLQFPTMQTAVTITLSMDGNTVQAIPAYSALQ